MSIALSTGLRNMMLGQVPIKHVATYTASTIAAVKGAPDSYTDSAGGFLTAGFAVGDTILVTGWTGANSGYIGVGIIATVVAGTIQLTTSNLFTASDAAGESITMVCLVGGSLRDIFKRGVLQIYSGTQPASADFACTGTLLLTITNASGAFTAGAVANGLEFGVAASGAISKSSQAWSGVGLATGTAGWFRLRGNAAD
jgi:hypothetical protein